MIFSDKLTLLTCEMHKILVGGWGGVDFKALKNTSSRKSYVFFNKPDYKLRTKMVSNSFAGF